MEATGKLYHGMYCEVTREQALDLLTIEGFECTDNYAGHWGSSGYLRYARYDDKIEYDGQVILSGIVHGEMSQKLPFPDFKQRLVNTVNQK